MRLAFAVACAVTLAVSCGGRQASAPPQDPPPTEQQAQAATPPVPPPAQQQSAEAADPGRPPAHEVQPAPPLPPPKGATRPPIPVESKPAVPAPPPPPPEPVIKTVPSGTPVTVVFLDGVSSAASKVGDPFRTRVAKDVVIDGVPVIPAGSVIAGTVVEAVSLKKIGGKAKLTLDFTRLELPSGRTALVHASLVQIGKSETKKDAATIGGAAAGGAILGNVLSKGDKTKGTVLGALAGAAAGTVIAAKTAGHEIEIPAGTESSLTLDQPTEVTLQP
jgi:hypothetical protein